MSKRINRQRIDKMTADERYKLACRVWSRLDDATRRDERPYYDGFDRAECERRQFWRRVWMSANFRLLIQLSQARKAPSKRMTKAA